jgi:hypothetical protein
MPSATIADHDIEVVATGGLMSAAPSLKLGKHCNFPVIRCGMVAPASKNNNRFFWLIGKRRHVFLFGGLFVLGSVGS